MSTNYYVYEHWTPTDEVYVGQTNNPRNRWGCDGAGYKTTSLWPYIEQFGWNAITHTVVSEFDNLEDALKCEDELIRKYRAQECCLNSKRSGLIYATDKKEYNDTYRNEHRVERRANDKKRRSSPEGMVYNRISSYNQRYPDRISISPKEAKQNYIKYKIIPYYIKHDDLEGTIYDPSVGMNQLSLF